MGVSLLSTMLLASLLAAGPADKAKETVSIKVTSLPLTSYLGSTETVPAVLVERTDQVERYVLGSLRLELRDKTLVWGQDRPLTFLAGAVRVDSGWVFVSSDGVFFSAANFLAPLKRLGQVDARIRLPKANGRAIAIDESGTLWTTTGAKGPAKVKALAEFTVLDAAFADANVGFALVAPGKTLYTDNGGKSWVELDLGDNGAFGLGLDRQRLMLEALDGRLVLNENSELVAEPNPEPAAVAALNRKKAERTLPKRYPLLMANRPKLPNGQLVEVHGREIRYRDPATTTVLRTDSESLPKGSQTPCRAVPFRGGVAFLCPSDQAPQLSLWFTKDGAAVTRLTDLYGDVDSLLVSEDKQSMVLRGFEGCKPGTSESAATTLCVLQAGTDKVAEVPYELPVDSDVDGMSGSTVLVYRGNESGEAAAHVLVSTKSDAHQLVDLRPAGTEESLTEARITADGLVYVLVREVVRTKGQKEARVGRLLRVLLSDAKGATRILAVPAQTYDLAFLDKTQALAVGDSAADIWYSGDAGKSWQALALPVDGDASTSASHPFSGVVAQPLSKPESEFGPLLSCLSPALCFAEFSQNRWMVEVGPQGPAAKVPQAAGPGKPEGGNAPYADTLFAAKKRKALVPQTVASGTGPADQDARWLAVSCEPASADLLANWTYEQADPNSSVPIQPTPFGGVEAGLEFTVNIQGDPRFRVYWNYARKKHTYSTSSKQSSPPWEDWEKPNVQRWQDKTPATYRILGGSEGALWLERCTQSGCRQLAVPSDGLPAWLPAWLAAGRPLQMAELAFDTDGSGYVHLTAPADLVAAADVHVLMRVAPDGKLAQRRLVLLPKWAKKEVHLGRLEGTYGLLAASWGQQEPGFLFFALGEENDSSPVIPGIRTSTSCPPKSETATSYWERSNYLLFDMNLADNALAASPEGLVQWSLVGQSWCVSGVELAATATLPETLVNSGVKDHLDNPPEPVRKSVEEPVLDEEEEGVEMEGTEPPVGPFKPGEFSGETDSPKAPAPDGGDADENKSESTDDEEGEEGIGEPDDNPDAAPGTPAGSLHDKPGVTFKDPGQEPGKSTQVSLAVKLYFAAVQGMFTGYLVGGVEPLQLLCRVKPVSVQHK